jgi:uncharacterized protein with FMN-binding domain
MDNQPTKRNNLPLKIGAGVLVILIYLGVTMYIKHTRDTKPAGTADTNTDTNTEQTNGGVAVYKDGTYTATGSYSSPGGQEQITLTVTLAGDKITATDAQTQAATPTSRQFQNEFINNYKPLVIGKNISSLKLTKVAGSSLTSKGFNDALSKIKTQAQS